MKKITLQLVLVLLIFIGACGDQAVFTNPDESVQDGTSPDDATDDTPIEYQGPDDYDLSLYFFHTNTQTPGGEIAFTEKYYEKLVGNGPIHSRTTRYLNTGTSIDSLSTDNAVFLQYVITVNSIKEIGVSYNGAQTVNRYTKLGEIYLDAVIESLGRRDTCTLQNHLDDFDLGDATGSVTIASGVYEDVLHVFCNRILDSEDDGIPTNYSWNGYYAKDVGLIFADGNWVTLEADSSWFVVGDAYLIPEY